MAACPGLSMHSKLEEFYREGKYTDVSIIVKGRTFRCHRIILSSASPFFDAMFCGNFKESNLEKVHLHDIDAHSFEKILKNIYGAKFGITNDNAFNLFWTSEYLLVQTIRDSCIEFILKNMYSIENVIEIFRLARALNISALVDPLLERISHDYIRLSENTAFLQMSFDDLRTILKLRLEQSSLFRSDDLLVDSLVRWLHYSYTERKIYFEILGAMLPSAKISTEYLKFLSKEYKLDLSSKQNNRENESFFDTYVRCSNERSSDHQSLCSVSFSDHQFSTSRSSIHLYLKENIFSINKYKPDGFISSVKKREIKSQPIKSLITSSESDYLYCINGVGFYTQSFCAYSSIDLLESDSQRLCPPPVLLGPKGAFDGKSKNIYFGWAGRMYQARNNTYSYATKYKAFTDEEFKRKVFYYKCEVDEWFTVPQVKKEEGIAARTVIGNNLVYFISYNGKVQAYDTRSSQCLKLSNTSLCYDHLSCCALNGMIYVGNGTNVEVFDPTANRWKIVKHSVGDELMNPPYGVGYMVPYENMIWLFEEKYNMPPYLDNYFYGLTLRVYNPNNREWILPNGTLSGKVILAKCFTVPVHDFLKDVIIF